MTKLKHIEELELTYKDYPDTSTPLNAENLNKSIVKINECVVEINKIISLINEKEDSQ